MQREPASDIRELRSTARTRAPAWALPALAAAAVIALGLWVLRAIIDAALLLFAGVLLAVFLRGTSGWITRRTRLPQPWSLVAVITVIAALIGLSAWLIAPSLAAQLDQLTARVPEAADRLRAHLEQYAWGRELTARLSDGGGLQPAGALRRATSILSSTAGLGTSFIVFLFLGLFLAAEPRLYRRGLLRLVPLPRRARAAEILDDTGEVLEQWLLGKFISMTAVGVLTYLGLRILGIPIALTLAVLAAALTFVPYIGPLLALLPAALIALLQGPTQAAYVVALYFGVQFVESYLLTPIVQRHTAALPPALTLLGQLVIGALTGALGVVLATPITAALMVLVKRIYVEDLLGDPAVDDGEAPLAGMPGGPGALSSADDRRTGAPARAPHP